MNFTIIFIEFLILIYTKKYSNYNNIAYCVKSCNNIIIICIVVITLYNIILYYNDILHYI